MTRRLRKTTLEDIARHAGVGMATVDRVLNERGGVSQQTTRRVLEAAKTLGTKRILPTEIKRRLLIEAVFARNHSAYYERLNEALQTVAEVIGLPVSVYRTHIDVDKPDKLSAHLSTVAGSRDGIILFANDLPQTAQVVQQLADKTTIVTISTDITDSGRHSYVGINNENAGQAAAKISEAICRKGGRVLAVTPETGVRAPLERLVGFTRFFEERDAEDRLLVFTPPSNMPVALSQLIQLLTDEDDIRVLYSPFNDAFAERVIEAGMQEQVIRSLAKITHDLSPHAISNLRSGLIDMVIDSNPMQQVSKAVDFIAREHGYVSRKTVADVDFQLYTSENLPRADRAD